MEEEQYVILGSDGKFWSGSKWVAEYPDAQIYNSYTKAEKTFTKLESDFRFDSTDDLMLIQDYGMDYERVILFGGADPDENLS